MRRYGAPDPTPYDEATPERLEATVACEPVESEGAARAAKLAAPRFEERKSGRGRTRRRRATVVS